MDVVIAGADGSPLFQTDDFTLDLAYGADQNDFELSGLPRALSRGWRWWVDGTPWGGVVDTVRVSASRDGVSALSYKGRSVQGVMASKVVEPPSGQSHLVVSGEANAVIGQLLDRCDVPWLVASADDSGIELASFSVHRYATLYDALRMALASAGARLAVAFVDGAPVLSAVAADTYGDVPSERVGFDAERTYRPVNHLIGLGVGEGASREVVHWYADASGAVSQTQTLTGLDEVEDTYDYSGSEDLSADTRAKLEGMQGQGTFEADLPDDAPLDVGDVVTASDAETGLSVEAQVTKVVVSVRRGRATVSYETGTPEWPEEEA